MTGVFIKRGNLDIDTHTGRMPCESRDWGNGPSSQRMPMLVIQPRREAQTDAPSHSQEGLALPTP